MNFKFFHGKQLDLPTQGRFDFLINYQQRPRQRYRLSFRSAIPRDQLPDHIFDQIVEDNVATLRNQVNYHGDVQSYIHEYEDGGFIMIFEIFY